MKVLYAGDSPIGGPANYLIAILRYLKCSWLHFPPSRSLVPSLFSKRFDAILLSDFPRKRVPLASERAMVHQVRTGTGLLMVGGWASFSGPYGGWNGSLLEEILPIRCRAGDDRLQFSGGALLMSKRNHVTLQHVSFRPPPVVCGFNRILPRRDSKTLLVARAISCRGLSIKLNPKEYPVLVIHDDPRWRTAAFATDLAPHWCGGLVDWGRRRLTLPVTGKIHVELGELYIRFVSSLLRWLSRT